jgi:hypothetical protein
MIFRDKKTGSLLNVRRDQYITDRMYFQEIIRVNGNGNGNSDTPLHRPRFTQPFSEFLIITTVKPR